MYLFSSRQITKQSWKMQETPVNTLSWTVEDVKIENLILSSGLWTFLFLLVSKTSLSYAPHVC
jgi:hypothetical protein